MRQPAGSCGRRPALPGTNRKRAGALGRLHRRPRRAVHRRTARSAAGHRPPARGTHRAHGGLLTPRVSRRNFSARDRWGSVPRPNRGETRRQHRPELPAADSTGHDTHTISRRRDVVGATSHLSKDADIGHGISCSVNFGQAKAQAGIERATRTGGCVATAFTGESFRRFAPMRAGQFTSLRVFERFASAAQRRFVAEKVSGPAVEAGANIRQIACDRAPAGQFGVVAGEGSTPAQRASTG